jgi:hypothetical protein
MNKKSFFYPRKQKIYFMFFLLLLIIIILFIAQFIPVAKGELRDSSLAYVLMMPFVGIPLFMMSGMFFQLHPNLVENTIMLLAILGFWIFILYLFTCILYRIKKIVTGKLIEKYGKYFVIAFFAVILLLVVIYTPSSLHQTKYQKISDFHGCKINLTEYVFNPKYRSDYTEPEIDLEEFTNHWQHEKSIACLCEKYDNPELSAYLEEYLNTYAKKHKSSLLQDADSWSQQSEQEQTAEYYIGLYGYDPREKSNLCVAYGLVNKY